MIIKDCRPYGLFVEIEPGIVALVHKSELSHKYVSGEETASIYSLVPRPAFHTASDKSLGRPGYEAIASTCRCFGVS